MTDQRLRLSTRMRNLLHFFIITIKERERERFNALEYHSRLIPISILYTRINSSYMTENMREVFIQAMCHFILQIRLSLWEFWTAGNTGRNLTVLGNFAVCRATAARSNLDGPVFQTHYEQEAASWIWMARVVSKRERVICWAVKIWNSE
jgi:hypothetical protein